MKAEYRDNPQAGPGHGTIIFSGAPISEGSWSVSIQRASDQAHATGKKTGQWVGETYYIDLPGNLQPDGSLQIPIGPALVDSLDQQDQYRVSLKSGPDEVGRCRLQLGAITHSPAGSVDLAATPREPKPGQAREPEPAPPTPQPLPVPAQAPARDNKKLLRYAIIGILALFCIGWTIMGYLRDQNEKRPPEISQPPSNESGKNDGARNKALPADSQPNQSQASGQKLESGDRARAFFSSANPTPEGAMRLAQTLPKGTPAEQDIIYRLYYFAGEKNEPSSLLAYGACLDPSKPQWGTVQKDAEAARKIYENAEKLNIEGAAQALADLRQWLEKRQASGNTRSGGTVPGMSK